MTKLMGEVGLLKEYYEHLYTNKLDNWGWNGKIPRKTKTTGTV